MARVRVDPTLKAALAQNGDRVELVDEAGKVIGLAYRVPDIYAPEGDPYDPEEVRAALADPREYTTEEVIHKLGLE